MSGISSVPAQKPVMWRNEDKRATNPAAAEETHEVSRKETANSDKE